MVSRCSNEEALKIIDDFDAVKPPVRAKMCARCPFARASIPGDTGPHTAREWAESAHHDVPMACHETIREDQSWVGTKQCAGMATFRSNFCFLPRNPNIATLPSDADAVFRWDNEMCDHHGHSIIEELAHYYFEDKDEEL